MMMLVYIAAAGTLGYLILVLVFSVRQASRLYLPSPTLHSTPAQHGWPFEELTLTTGDGETLHGWYVPSPDTRHTVLFCHGTRGNISDLIDTIAMYQSLRLNILLFDYRGYGRSSGRPSEHGTYLDALAAWDYLIQTRKLAPADIIIHGRSLGAAIGAHLAARHTPQALIVESTFTSLPEVAARRYRYLPIKWIARFHYPVRHYLRQVRCPILVIHGSDDEVIPYHHAEQLLAEIRGEKRLLQIAGNHYAGYLHSGPVYRQGIAEFIGSVSTH
ncbi:MAG: alpha/beta hydrolase [Gammaproteobacteria bacterium]|nr:alpha/beta hydrolase [Gammaproteobacteria bacterium]